MNTVEWESFERGLAEELAGLPAGALVVIFESGEGDGGRYAQFAQEPDRLIAEVVANSFLEPGERATDEGERAIAGAGWRPPAPSEGRENWWTDLAWPALSERYLGMARMVATALRDGYGIAGPDGFHYRAWNEKQGNDPIDLPRLGLPRRAPNRT